MFSSPSQNKNNDQFRLQYLSYEPLLIKLICIVYKCYYNLEKFLEKRKIMYKILILNINNYMQIFKNRKTQNFRGLKIGKKF